MSEIFSAQLTAVATLALAALALATAVLAGLAFRKQSREVGILIEQNQRDTDERRRTQAAKVFLGAPPDTGLLVSPYAHNASDFPVYDAQVWYYEPATGVTGPDTLGIIMPGEQHDAERAFSAAEALRLTFLTFRDAEGLNWVRTPSGSLRERQRRPRDEIRHITVAATPPGQIPWFIRDSDTGQA